MTKSTFSCPIYCKEKQMLISDLLIRLYNLDTAKVFDYADDGIIIRKPIGPEVAKVIAWVKRVFGSNWASEAMVALGSYPFSCYIALKDSKIRGFCCYNATALGYIGPVGVARRFRRKGIGKGLLLSCCREMRRMGYGYAVVGWVSEENVAFYKNTAGAFVIPESDPGIYAGMISDK